MFTLVCAIIPAAGLVPSALAQEDITSLDEDLARGILMISTGLEMVPAARPVGTQ
jgi:hypothetical protein